MITSIEVSKLRMFFLKASSTLPEMNFGLKDEEMAHVQALTTTLQEVRLTLGYQTVFISFRGGLSQGRTGLDPNKKIELDLKVPPP